MSACTRARPARARGRGCGCLRASSWRSIVGQTDNRFMPRPLLAAALLWVAACTPTFNWREMAVGPTGLRATFPCKPDQVERRTAFLPGREIVLHAVGC